jgi:prepilin-type N-terminal cleavage/methylation domain-containing protein/prepilin-type processing-associated H-X9-DG protein
MKNSGQAACKKKKTVLHFKTAGLETHMSLRRGLTLIETLVVLGIAALLLALVIPGLRNARTRSAEMRCLANLSSVGQMLHAHAAADRDTLAPALRERDDIWGAPGAAGWDITVGNAFGVPGGTRTVWTCPVGLRPYVGNTRALGLRCMPDTRYERHWRVQTSMWAEPGRLVLAYDVQPDMVGLLFPRGDEPGVGDLSDEMDGAWPRDSLCPEIPADFGPLGPHERAFFGVLFADGHAAAGTFPGNAALLWSGRRWWPDEPLSWSGATWSEYRLTRRIHK